MPTHRVERATIYRRDARDQLIATPYWRKLLKLTRRAERVKLRIDTKGWHGAAFEYIISGFIKY